MPLDAITLRALTEELRPQLLNLRIDKVQQPARDQVILLLRGNKRLLLNAGTNAPRLQLTELLRDNPAEPPMFCMLLRKHLVGARVADITQPGLERLVRIELDVTDDFGQPGHRTLVLEAMPPISECPDSPMPTPYRLLPSALLGMPHPLKRSFHLNPSAAAWMVSFQSGDALYCHGSFWFNAL